MRLNLTSGSKVRWGVGLLAWALVCGGFFETRLAFADEAPPRVLPVGRIPLDARLKKARTYNDKVHPWQPPATKDAWEAEKERIRQQILVGVGLWPMPQMAPLEPVIHGAIDREDYTVEKVCFQSLPGHYVTGNLYRPKNPAGKLAGVLCPHGHWLNGRFYDAGEEGAKKQIDKQAEKFNSGARFPLQARMVGLARMGCVVFHYDMVGYADNQPIGHRTEFHDVGAVLQLHELMGLQTLNSIRSLDFLLSLPGVDSSRIGVTGASGGGTQTFILGAVDPRPTAVFPAVMVGTAMQGGCQCENSSYLRLGLNNIAIAAMFAPKPQAMSGADDWTIDIEKKGLPELKQIYGLYGAADNVHARCFPQFEHNYNQVAREMMYDWFNQHLKLGQASPVVEREFIPVPPKELSVFDAQHPVPTDNANVNQVRSAWTARTQAQLQSTLIGEQASLAKFRDIVGPASRVLFGGYPAGNEVTSASPMETRDVSSYREFRVSATRVGAGEQVPAIGLIPAGFNGTVVLWLDGQGKSHLFQENGRPTAAVEKLFAAGVGVASVDLFMTGEYLPSPEFTYVPKVNSGFPGYTYGYNRPLLCERVRDILTALAGLKKTPGVFQVHLAGSGDAGLWTLLARSQAGSEVSRTVVDLGGFTFGKVTTLTDPNLLPGGLKYGGVGGFAALVAPRSLVIGGVAADEPELQWAQQAYALEKATLELVSKKLTPDDIVNRLLAK